MGTLINTGNANMKFALVDGLRTEPQPGLKGACTNCQSDSLAKCGKIKVWHWAHKSKISCDPWWENETEWHRAWKNIFPKEWQENIHIDPITGEKHIADVKTASNLVIEFQHSAIDPTETQSREAFYKNMVWLVDGTRLKRDYPRFCKGFNDLRQSIQPGIFLSLFPEELLPASWLTGSVPIYFDFQGTDPTDDTEDRLRSPLWCLFPGRVEKYAVIAGVSREQFINFSSSDPHLLFAHEILSNISEAIRLQREFANTNTNAKRLHPTTAFRPRRHRRF